jgi:Tol biopolymer transport system component
MSVDLSPDGRWIVFDLLANIYRIPSAGGDATCLTCDSGLALNFEPRFSPDGSQIAFISDRKGQDNLWVMEADGSRSQPIFLDSGSRVYEPTWSPDGSAIIATRYIPHIAGYHDPHKEIWRFPLSGAKPELLARGKSWGYRWPSLSPDGKILYYFTSYPTWSWAGQYTGEFLQARNLAARTLRYVREHPHEPLEPTANPYADDRAAGTMLPSIAHLGPAEFAPEASPDGRYLAFVMRQPGQAFQFRGHSYGPRDAMIVRDLTTGQERTLVESVSIDLDRIDAGYSTKIIPGYSWARDSRSIVLSGFGKIQRVYLDTGRIQAIPFMVHVRRELSEMTRGHVRIDDQSQRMTFMQWPAGSPDGKTLLWVYAGKIWTQALPSGRPRQLIELPDAGIQLTPAWAQDSHRIAFTTWSDSRQGQVWSVAQDGTDLRRLTRVAGQYLYPAWRPDGETVIVAKGPGINDRNHWSGWDVTGNWDILKISADEATNVTTVAQETQPHIGPNGEVFYYEYKGPAMQLMSVFPGGTPRLRALLQRRSKTLRAFWSPSGNFFHPLISPDGRFVVFEVAYSIYVSPIKSTQQSVAQIETDPNVAVANRIRLGNKGGIYAKWRDGHTIEFVSGDRYFTYDVNNKALTEHAVELTIPRAASAKGTIAFENARILVGERNEIIDHGNVLIRDARITCVGRCDTSSAERHVDASGKTIMPGLIDTHAHSLTRSSRVVTAYQPDLATQLAYGVTTILDPHAESTSALPIRAMTEAGLILGPRVFTTLEAAFGFDDWSEIGHREIETYEDAEYRVDRRISWGATSLKNYWMNRRDQQQMFLDVGRRRGVTITSEGGPVHRNISVILDGQTGWEHFVPAIPIYSDVTKFYGMAGAVYAPTLTICGHPFGAVYFYRSTHNLLEDSKYNRFMPRTFIEESMRYNVVPGPDEYSVPLVAEGVKDTLAAGGHTAMGAHGTQPGIGAHWDLWAFSDVLGPLGAIEVATYSGAYFHGLDHEIGSIRAGKIADLIVLKSDPLQDIRNTLDIQYVMKGGHLYDSDTLKEIWPGERPYAPLQ